MDKLPALKPLKLEGNLAENWRRWKQRYELFMTATEASKKPEKFKAPCYYILLEKTHWKCSTLLSLHLNFKEI